MPESVGAVTAGVNEVEAGLISFFDVSASGIAISAFASLAMACSCERRLCERDVPLRGNS